jgi:ankyrin repeat protein
LVAGNVAFAAAAAPFVDAVKRQDLSAVNALLDRGAAVDAGESDGATALHWAAQLDDLATVDALLQAGAKAANTGRLFPAAEAVLLKALAERDARTAAN